MLRYIYVQPLYRVWLELLLLPPIWALAAVLLRRQRRLFCRCNVLFAVCSAAAICCVTLLGRSSGEHAVYLIPFITFLQARKNAELYRAMLMNVLLFEPLGLSLPFALDGKSRHPFRDAVLGALLLSFAIEVLQFAFCLGQCETDDLIMNTLGAALGAAAWCLSAYAERWFGYRGRQ